MAMRVLHRLHGALAPTLRAPASASRAISTTPVRCASGTKKGKVVDAKKSGYKGGTKKQEKKGAGTGAGGRKEAGTGAALVTQVKAKPKTVESKVAMSDPEREEMLAELKRLAKETSRLLMREHRERQYSEKKMLMLKQAAVAALPPHLREKAKPPTLFPAKRVPPTMIPPIEGYADETVVTKKIATVKKMR